MALILKNDVLYLHIPKTGGNWLSEIIRREKLLRASLSHKHATFDYAVNPRIKTARSKGWLSDRRALWYLSKNPKIFCVVRHPLRWYESWFKYQTARDWRDWGQIGHLKDWHVMSELNRHKLRDFNAFMTSVNKCAPGFVGHLYARYTVGTGATVLRNESLAQDFLAFSDKIGWMIDRDAVLGTPRIGESPSMTLDWDPAVAAETLRCEYPAMKAYGYAFAAPADQPLPQ